MAFLNFLCPGDIYGLDRESRSSGCSGNLCTRLVDHWACVLDTAFDTGNRDVFRTARVMHASITQQSMRDSSNGLEVAASFYVNGFATATKSVGFGSSYSPSENIRPRLLILLFESAWTAITWFAILLLMGNSLAHDALNGILYLFI
jgi:hypothetical protein